MFRRWVLPWLLLILYRLWSATWRVKRIESSGLQSVLREDRPIVFAHWHGDELKILPLLGPYRVATMTSTSKDGELIDFIVRHLGGATSRGSSTRGGITALKGLLRLMRDGYRASVAVDGPKGPLHKAKPGVFEISRLANAVIIPLGAATNRAIVFNKSWNKAALPKPFAKICVWFGEPIGPLTRDDDAKDPKWPAQLELAITNACQEAARNLT